MGVPLVSDKKQTEEIGVVLTKCRKVNFTGLAGNLVLDSVNTYIYSGSGGDVVLYNRASDETNVVTLGTGDYRFIAFHEILVSATIDGSAFTTAPGLYNYGITGQIS